MKRQLNSVELAPFHPEEQRVVEHLTEALRVSNDFALRNDSSSQPQFIGYKTS